jgi:hypothetical protein
MRPLSPTARSWTLAYLAVLGVLVLTGNTYNHVPTGLWLLVGAIAFGIYESSQPPD